MTRFSRRKLKRLCTRCYTPCENTIGYVTCEGCTRCFHNKCLYKSQKHKGKHFNNEITFFCSKKCELSVFPFNLMRDKEFSKINAIEIKEPCTQCGGDCYKFDRIQCDGCDKWTHQVCSSLTKQEFEEIGKTSKEFICSKKCELRIFPFSNLSKQKFKTELNPNDSEGNENINVSPAIKVTQEQRPLDVNEIAEDEPYINCNYVETNQVHKLGLIHGLNDLTLFHANVASLQKNLYKVEELFRDAQKMPDIIGVTETKLPLSETDKQSKTKNSAKNIDLKGYYFEDCPTPTDAGGAGIYISKHLDYDVRNDLKLNLDRCEDFWIQLINDKNKKEGSESNNLVIGVVYRHPGSQFKEFEKKMCNIINGLNQNQTNFVIMGDMNINLLKKNIVSNVTNYINNLQGAGCLSLVDRATRVVRRGSRWEISCVSHIYTNLNIDKTETSIITSAISDHFSVYTKLNQMKTKHIQKTEIYSRKKSLSQAELLNFNNELQATINGWNFENTNVHDSADYLIKIYQNLIEKYLPMRKLSRKEKSFYFKPWLTTGIRKSMQTRDALHRKSLKSKNEEDYKYYKRYKNFVTRMQVIAYNDYFEDKISVNQKNKNKKKVWETVNEIANYKRRKHVDIKRLFYNENEVRGTKNIANCLNKHFNSIGKTMADKIHNPKNTNSQSLDHIPDQITSAYFGPTTLAEVVKLIRSLQIHKAAGPDGITSYIIKKTETVLAPVLVKLFNKCLVQGTFPDSLKIAKIVPLHKGGAKEQPTNYRPISLLPQFSKLLEKIIKNRLSSFLDKNNILTKHQFGFRKSHSTELAITSIQDTLLKNLDDGKLTCTVFLDLAKAFDSVDHSILLKKLEKYGIRGTPLQLLKSYLTNRQHLTKLNDIESDLKVLDVGVPQGSILGPILFLLFINDLPNVTKFDVKLFADDTFLSLEGADYKTLEKNANIELRKINRWFSANKLTLNISKSKYMIIKRRYRKGPDSFVLKFNGKKMERCRSYLYLGIYLDENLDFKKHISYLCDKISKLCGMFSKLRHCCNKNLLKTIYYALIESHLQYCSIIWGNANENAMKPLVTLQNKIIKIMCFSPFGSSDVDHLYDNLKLLKINELHKLAKAKFIFKFKHDKLPPSFENFLTVNHSQHQYMLRSRDTNDYKCVWGKTQYGMKRMQYEGVRLWNTIPLEIRASQTIEEFAKGYKSFLIQS